VETLIGRGDFVAHYAFLNEDNIVVNVIVGRNEDEVVDGISDWEAHYAEVVGMTCKRTSYNTHNNQHLLGGTPFRYNYAQIDGTYDPVKDGFIPVRTYKAWTVDPETLNWIPPVPMPDSSTLNEGESYYWNDLTDEWLIATEMITD
jgi:hypothetical protein